MEEANRMSSYKFPLSEIKSIRADFPDSTYKYVSFVKETKYNNLSKAFEYLISMLPPSETDGFVAHARAIASGNKKRIADTK